MEQGSSSIDRDDSDDESDAPDLILVDGGNGAGDTDADGASASASAFAPASAPDLPPVPVTILAGFLGSGKTTLVRHILSSPDHGYRIAVIENEFGGGDDGGGDAERAGLSVETLIARDGLTGSSLTDLIELANGCVCCTVKGSMVTALEELLTRRSDLDYIIIEASGMADPGPVASVFWLDGELGSRIRLDGVVVCVDAANIVRQLGETSAKSGGGEEAARQIAWKFFQRDGVTACANH